MNQVDPESEDALAVLEEPVYASNKQQVISGLPEQYATGKKGGNDHHGVLHRGGRAVALRLRLANTVVVAAIITRHCIRKQSNRYWRALLHNLTKYRTRNTNKPLLATHELRTP